VELHLQSLLLPAVLVILLILREWQNSRTIKHLLDRLLAKHGIDPLPDEHPLAAAIKELLPEREEWPPKELGTTKAQRRDKVTVKFPVPGMDVLKAMLNREKAE
jgi:hypothetical protein